MSKICSSHNLSELEQLNHKLSNSVLLLRLSVDFLFDNLDLSNLDLSNSDKDRLINSSISLIYDSIDNLNLSVNNYFLFDDCLHRETDF